MYHHTVLAISSDEADVHFTQIIPNGVPVSMFLSVCLRAIGNSWASLMKSVETIELRAITGLCVQRGEISKQQLVSVNQCISMWTWKRDKDEISKNYENTMNSSKIFKS